MAHITKVRSHGRVDVADLDAAQGARVVCGGTSGRVVALRDATTEVLLCDQWRVHEGDRVELAPAPHVAPAWRAGTVVGPDGALLSEIVVTSQPTPTVLRKRNHAWRTGVAAADMSVAPSYGSAVLTLVDSPAALSEFVESVIQQQRLDGVHVVRLAVAQAAPPALEGAMTVAATFAALEGLPFALEAVCDLAKAESAAGKDVLILVDDFEGWRRYSEAVAMLVHEERSKPLADLLLTREPYSERGRVSVLCATAFEPTTGFDDVWNLRSIELPGGLDRWLSGRRPRIPYPIGGIRVSFGDHRSLGSAISWMRRMGDGGPLSAWLSARGMRHIPPLQLVLAAMRANATTLPPLPADLDAWLVEAEAALKATLPEIAARAAEVRSWDLEESQAVRELVQRLAEPKLEVHVGGLWQRAQRAVARARAWLGGAGRS